MHRDSDGSVSKESNDTDDDNDNIMIIIMTIDIDGDDDNNDNDGKNDNDDVNDIDRINCNNNNDNYSYDGSDNNNNDEGRYYMLQPRRGFPYSRTLAILGISRTASTLLSCANELYARSNTSRFWNVPAPHVAEGTFFKKL